METQDNGFLLVIDGVRKEKERLTAAKLLYCLTKIIEKLGNKKQRVPGPDNTMQRWRIGYEGLKRRWKRKSLEGKGLQTHVLPFCHLNYIQKRICSFPKLQHKITNGSLGKVTHRRIEPPGVWLIDDRTGLDLTVGHFS